MKSALIVLAAFFALGKAAAHLPAAVPDGIAEREALRAHILAEWRASRPVAGPRAQVAGSSAFAALAAAAVASAANSPASAKPFLSFARLELKWDDNFLYVGSSGWPDHPMMVGITNWQQQVPLPQSYFGANAWRIPLHPVAAEEPAMLNGRLLRGAVALAVNGIPIFNPQNNRGEVSYEIGELDQWGGHCGRADDYHYHIAPLHLQSVVGKGMPIAYALDGYPIYGVTEPDGSPVGKLDECAGHELAGVGYHYHASMKPPYVMAGFHGQVTEAGGQVDPQPRAEPVREALQPLRGAKITGFENLGENRYELTYSVGSAKHAIRYAIKADGSFPFEFDDGQTPQVYTKRGGGKGPKEKRQAEPTPAREAKVAAATPGMDLDGDGFVSAREYADQARRAFAANGNLGSLPDAMVKARAAFMGLDRNGDGKLDAVELGGAPAARGEAPASGGFTLTSPEVKDGGSLPVEFTGDGSGATLPLEWRGAPAGTESYAIVMDHLDPEGVMKGYWIVWDIPGSVTRLTKNVKGIGKVGVGFKGEIGYEPPHSKGPGLKTYVLHVYALSEAPKIASAASAVNREVLMTAMHGRILARADLHVTYERAGSAGQTEAAPRKEPKGRPAAAEGGQRKPWIQVHGPEMDADKDGLVTLTEMKADMERAAAKYDGNRDGVITPPEIDAAGDLREGAAFAGFIYRHAIELDADNDSRLTTAELSAAVEYFFTSADQDRNGSLSAAEIAAAPNAPLPVPGKVGAGAPPRREGGAPERTGGGLIKASMRDTMKLNVYADNWFMLYVNGRLVAVDPIDFIPHNVVSVDFLPEYPMTIAVLAKDNADPKTGLEYGNHVGDGGFILKFADGTVTNGTWKAKNFFRGPLSRDGSQPQVKIDPLPDKWWTVEFNDSQWPNAKEFTEAEVNPKEPYFQNDFAGAKFIWSDDLALDNTVIFRTRIEKPGWKPAWNTKPDLDVTGAPFR